MGIPLICFALRAGGTRTHSSGPVRWTGPTTSANTGGYIYFNSSPLRRIKMHIEFFPVCYATHKHEKPA